MLHGWFTIVAQAINFLILVWLLKRFLYKPILNAIDVREKGIAAQLADAVAKKAEAKKDRDEFQAKNAAFDKDRAALLTKATDEAKTEHDRLIAEARKDADALRAKRQAALQTEQKNLDQEILRWTRDRVFNISRKTLKDLAGASLEERIGDVFVQRVRSLSGPAKDQMVAALKASNQTVSVHSAFDLPPAQQAAIEAAVKETFAPEAHVQFETAPELVSGVELTTNGQKVAWSIADYLATLEKSAADLLHDDPKPEAEPAPKPKPEAQAKPDPKGNAKPKADGKPALQPANAAPKGHS